MNASVGRYNIVMLGMKGSGKTTYLATLNHLLSRSAIANGIVVTATPAIAHAELEDIYISNADPNQPWLPSTLQHREWVFTCHVRARKRSFSLLEFAYLDYRGELLERGTHSNLEAAEEFFASLDSNAAMLALVDGEKVLRVFEGHLSPQDFYTADIDPLMSWINRCPGPVHIAVSKWDLLQDRRRSLSEVVDLLLNIGNGQLRRVIQDRVASSRSGLHRGLVRLIPISSLANFAYLGPDGKMKKDPASTPRPLNVDIPIVAVLPDLIVGAYEQFQINLMAAKEAKKNNKTPESGSVDWLAQIVGQAQDNATGRLMTLFILLAAGAVGMVKVSSRLAGPLETLAVRLPRPLSGVTSQRSALIYASRALARWLRRFQAEYPESRLR